MTTYDHTLFNKKIKTLNSSNNILSIVFNNIDGNASNFDSFTADLSQYQHKFTFIGIAETNLNEQNSGLHNINGYNLHYNSKLPGKSKGSGLGIYLHEKSKNCSLFLRSKKGV